ncbi:MAG: carbohydrate ABC transporter permease [Deltaproteobacteria bacterium]|nr:carbohydrate ABC transporter permease [Deltaproteobacteria bacterium]
MITRRFTLGKTIQYIFISIVAITIIYPLLNVLAISFSGPLPIMQNKISFYPKDFNISAYKEVLTNPDLLLSYWNTIKYVTIGIIISMVVTISGAYALSKGRRMFGYKFFNVMIIITMFFGGGLIPEYLTMKSLRLIDTTWIIVLIGAVSAWNLMVMRTFFRSIPAELEDAGRIDGLGDYGILWFIVLPLSSAIIATISLFYGVALWNAYFVPYIYLKDQAKFPIQILLKQYIIAGTTISQETAQGLGDSLIVGEALVNATITVAIAPIILIYPFLQKYFVKGVMIGSLKG